VKTAIGELRRAVHFLLDTQLDKQLDTQPLL
jgi:hypothetical protein